MFSLSGDFEAKRYLNFLVTLELSGPSEAFPHPTLSGPPEAFPHPMYTFWFASKASPLTGHF